ncbi:MAG: NUDIX hydrolase [Dehalococcoidia bacterium]|nr:MAG: NUDIX hydrolase [Dehalococcoidia bacterium]
MRHGSWSSENSRHMDYLYGMRDRATAVVWRDGLLLLVRDRGFRQFSLPGGGLREGETAEEAVARELEEETGLSTVSVSPLPQCETSDIYNTYLVFEVQTAGTLHIDPGELSAARWWDGREAVPLFGYVARVLARLHWPK